MDRIGGADLTDGIAFYYAELRFIVQDTYEGQIDNPLSLNLYTYVGNNPLKYTDPSGHCPMCIPLLIWGGEVVVTAALASLAISDTLQTINDVASGQVDYSQLAIYAAISRIPVPKNMVVSGIKNLWGKMPFIRGNHIDDLLGNNLGRFFPTVDKLENRNLISIKSHDLTAKSNQGEKLYDVLKNEINDLYNFKSARRGGVEVTEDDYDIKTLELAFNNVELTSAQSEALQKATDFAQGLGVNIKITIVE